MDRTPPHIKDLRPKPRVSMYLTAQCWPTLIWGRFNKILHVTVLKHASNRSSASHLSFFPVLQKLWKQNSVPLVYNCFQTFGVHTFYVTVLQFPFRLLTFYFIKLYSLLISTSAWHHTYYSTVQVECVYLVLTCFNE